MSQRKEDPDTQCGFFKAETEAFGGQTYYVLAFARDAQGRKVKSHRGIQSRNKAAYYRLVRPCTGFSQKDMPREGEHTPAFSTHDSDLCTLSGFCFQHA